MSPEQIENWLRQFEGVAKSKGTPKPAARRPPRAIEALRKAERRDDCQDAPHAPRGIHHLPNCPSQQMHMGHGIQTNQGLRRLILPMNITAIIICIGLVGIIAAIALLGRWAAKNLDEANDAKHPADEAEKPICAWCHPGIDHAAGHGICQRHAEELSAKAYVASQSGPLE